MEEELGLYSLRNVPDIYPLGEPIHSDVDLISVHTVHETCLSLWRDQHDMAGPVFART